MVNLKLTTHMNNVYKMQNVGKNIIEFDQSGGWSNVVWFGSDSDEPGNYTDWSQNTCYEEKTNSIQMWEGDN